MTFTDPDDLENDDETPKNKELKQLVVRLDADHYAALGRIAKSERMKRQEAVKHLIRFADQLVSGAESPFSKSFVTVFHQNQRKAG